MSFPVSESLLQRIAREDYSALMRSALGVGEEDWEPIRRRILAMTDAEFLEAVKALCAEENS